MNAYSGFVDIAIALRGCSALLEMGIGNSPSLMGREVGREVGRRLSVTERRNLNMSVDTF